MTGGLDVLVCNAGADTLTGPAGKQPFDDKLDALLSVDVKSTIRLARNLGFRMKSRGRGAIITMGWDQAEMGMAGDSGQLFAAAKGAVMCFTRSLALELAPEVRVNCIAPGWIRTAWGETAGPAWQERVRLETPLGVWGLPEDVAAAAVWLASPAAGFVTGQTILVNGGAVRG
jgi:NAD(P)-dependent dehydrogenase (short-subunit alcohol dehydrogenase family)